MLFSDYLLMTVIMKQSSFECLHNTKKCGSLSVRAADVIYQQRLNTLRGDSKLIPVHLDKLCHKVFDKKHLSVTNNNNKDI